MNEKELKDYQNKLMSGAKGTIGLGVVTGVGSTVLGKVAGDNPAAAPALGAANTALNFAAIGNMAAIGMSIMPGQENPEQRADKKRNMKTSKKSSAMDNPASWF